MSAEALRVEIGFLERYFSVRPLQHSGVPPSLGGQIQEKPGRELITRVADIFTSATAHCGFAREDARHVHSVDAFRRRATSKGHAKGRGLGDRHFRREITQFDTTGRLASICRAERAERGAIHCHVTSTSRFLGDSHGAASLQQCLHPA